MEIPEVKMIDPVAKLKFPLVARTRSYRRKLPMCFQDGDRGIDFDDSDTSEKSWILQPDLPILVIRVKHQADTDCPADGDNIYEVVDPSGQYVTLAGRYIDCMVKS